MEDDKDNIMQVCEERSAEMDMMRVEHSKGLLHEIMRENSELVEEIKKLEAELQSDAREFLIKENVPERKLKFTSVERPEDGGHFSNSSCSFQMSSQILYELQKGQALITFEKEEVAQNVIDMGEHVVQMEGTSVKISAHPVPLNTGVRFQVHVDISKMKINVMGIPDELSEEQTRDKLELSFCKSRNGGGEVESVDYDRKSRSAVITFVEAGVASALKVKDPTVSERTVVVSGLPVGLLKDQLVKRYFPEEGGQVEEVVYPSRSKGVAYIIFKEKKVAQDVIRQKKHTLISEPPLTVSRFSEKVFNHVMAILDLSVFRTQIVLENLVTDLKKKIPTLNFSPLGPSGKISVQGPYLAIVKLKQALISKATPPLENNREYAGERRNRNGPTPRRILQKGETSASILGTSVPEPASSPETLVLDTDIFLYLKHKCEFYHLTLSKYHVLCQERVDGDVTTICLRETGDGSCPGSVRHVKEFIEECVQEFHLELRKEVLVLEGRGDREKRNIRQAVEELRGRYPRVT
ncbi:RNA-binding protein 43 [Apodemus speciosus]|uniref:RNA-binding protein 43 n=1 Tax=Apodemus speciosus TaxID=105296 RepID=A0ABQ0EH69_APOSI